MLCKTKENPLSESLTIAINVDSTGVTFSVVVGIGLVSVSLKQTVITAVTYIVSV